MTKVNTEPPLAFSVHRYMFVKYYRQLLTAPQLRNNVYIYIILRYSTKLFYPALDCPDLIYWGWDKTLKLYDGT